MFDNSKKNYNIIISDFECQLDLSILQRELHQVTRRRRVCAQQNAILLFLGLQKKKVSRYGSRSYEIVCGANLETKGQVFGLAEPFGLEFDTHVLTVCHLSYRGSY